MDNAWKRRRWRVNGVTLQRIVYQNVCLRYENVPGSMK